MQGGRGGQWAMPPKPWIKKLRLSWHGMHIDVLPVAAINDHKTARKQSSFAPFQAYDMGRR